ncbi:RNA-binding protein NOB1 [Pseudoscourfieldia marina]
MAAVVDANALITAFDVRRVAHKLLSTSEVLAEVRDKHARTFASLIDASGGIDTREPADEDVAWVVRFARRTGDAAALSRADVRLLALTLTVEREVTGHDKHIRRVPPPLERTARHNRRTTALPGWGVENTQNDDGWDELDEEDDAAAAVQEPSRVAAAPTPMTVEAEKDDDGDEAAAAAAPVAAAEQDGGADEWEPVQSRSAKRMSMRRDARRREKEEEAVRELEEAAAGVNTTAAAAAAQEGEEGGGGGDDDDDVDEHGDVADEDDGDDGDDATPAAVALVTADRAMQNVALQMKLKLVSPTGEVVDRLRRYVLQCSACHKMADLSRKGTSAGFCGNCGNWGTLVRATVEVGTSGATVVVDQNSAQKLRALRGTRYSLPKPRGGRDSVNVVLREDQLRGTAAAGDAPRQDTQRRRTGNGDDDEEEEEEEDRAAREYGASNVFKQHRHEGGGLGKRDVAVAAAAERLGYGLDGSGATPVVDNRGNPYLRRNPNERRVTMRRKGK